MLPHNLKVVGSNPAPATKLFKGLASLRRGFFFVIAAPLPHMEWNGTFISFGWIVRPPDLQPVNLKVLGGMYCHTFEKHYFLDFWHNFTYKLPQSPEMGDFFICRGSLCLLGLIYEEGLEHEIYVVSVVCSRF
jgi:hypothetical protein